MGESRKVDGGQGTSRRSVLKGITATISISSLPMMAQASAPAPVLDFLALSSRLTGIPLDRSYIQLAETIRTLLTLDGDAGISALARQTAPADWEEAPLPDDMALTARRILTAWYQGTVDIPARHRGHPSVVKLFGELPANETGQSLTVLITYDEAVVWRSCDFTKPSATCGGPFGYWGNPA